ncbi:glycine zipper 2TM domain-containing protein [Paraburkholderia phosphatilytica]|uniref:glycine zipper 2TM domain-containing protein n=1 Tax=Paraburkholderia phosphatilytica TaxID=2282883 RepID=UPI000E4CD4A9|nr:glycine zipper 2TM domain-containing protein [Paraburkholderia phosphatilytica]
MDNINEPRSPKRLHPLIATAAGAVIVASLAATAAITGVFPKASSTSAQSDQTTGAPIIASSQPVVDSAAPAGTNAQQQAQLQQQQAAAAQQQAQQQQAQAQPQQPEQPAPQTAQQVPAQPYPQQQQPNYAQQPQYAQQAPAPAAVCSSCGVVEGISAQRQEGHGTGIGAVGGALAGGVVGNQFGSGGGRTAMTILGAVGGGFAGNAVEKHVRSTTVYSVRVHMENGRTRYFTYHEAPPFQQGERVRIQNGTLVAG